MTLTGLPHHQQGPLPAGNANTWKGPRTSWPITRAVGFQTASGIQLEIALLREEKKICSADQDSDMLPFPGTELLLKLIKVPRR